jgi:hypothetical protein
MSARQVSLLARALGTEPDVIAATVVLPTKWHGDVRAARAVHAQGSHDRILGVSLLHIGNPDQGFHGNFWVVALDASHVQQIGPAPEPGSPPRRPVHPRGTPYQFWFVDPRTYKVAWGVSGRLPA